MGQIFFFFRSLKNSYLYRLCTARISFYGIKSFWGFSISRFVHRRGEKWRQWDYYFFLKKAEPFTIQLRSQDAFILSTSGQAVDHRFVPVSTPSVLRCATQQYTWYFLPVSCLFFSEGQSHSCEGPTNSLGSDNRPSEHLFYSPFLRRGTAPNVRVAYQFTRYVVTAPLL